MPDENLETHAPAPAKKPALGLSLAQLVGGSAAAATAAVLGARLGTTGTIIGAALVSIVSAVASAIYTASIRRTQEVVAKTKELLPTTSWMTARQELPEIAEQAAEEGVEEATPSVWSRVRWKSVAIAAGAFFVVTALLVTGYELVSGRSIEGGGSTTVNNAFHGGAKASTPTPTPTSTPTGKASSKATSSPTSSPTTSQSATPTATASSNPSATTSPSATTAPTATSSPSASPTE